MSNYFEILGLELDASGSEGKARNALLESMQWAPTPTTSVSYSTANRLLIIADRETARAVESALPERILCYVATPSETSGASTRANAWNAAGLSVSGYLGRFRAYINSAGDPGDAEDDPEQDREHNNLARIFNIESGYFDQVLDCGAQPLIRAAVKPPGYYHAADEAVREGYLAAIPEMIGEFEKPKYFDYDPDICAHGRSGIPGCTRCIDACPTDAIISLGETVKINPHLCQGGGSCTAGCPTGAISYRYPRPEEQLELLRQLLRDFRGQRPDCGPCLLVFGNENDREAVESVASRLPAHVIPLVVEEIGAAGLDLLSCALAYGAAEVLVYAPDSVPQQVREVIERNLALLRSVLEQSACRSRVIEMIHSVADLPDRPAPAPCASAATFAPVGGKRDVIRSALGFLREVGETPPEFVALPEGSLFGAVHLAEDACTLCMGCVSQCPAGALQAGGDTPALRFIEKNCVQCGICTRTCPESAVRLEARLHFDHDLVSRARTLKEEEPFRCISCGKPFATKAMIGKMTEKLKGHWMFDKPDAFKRLQMCEDCRVIDLFDKENRAN